MVKVILSERKDDMQLARRIISVLLVLILCFSFCGCGEDAKPKKKKKVIIIKKRPTSSASSTTDENDFKDNYEFWEESDDSSLSELEQFEDEDSKDESSQGNNSETDTSEDNWQDSYISDRELAEKEDIIEEEIKPEYVVKASEFAEPKGYTIIYPDKNEQLRQAAKKLATYFAKYNIKVKVASDTTPKNEKEILLGDTNRKKSLLSERKYAVSVSGKQLFFESGNFNGVIKAVLWFISLPYKKGKINTLSGEYDFKSQVKRPDGMYTYVWGDEFDGNALDTSKWDLTSSIGAESSFKLSRDPQALNVSDGLLKLSALRWFDPDNDQIQAIAPYTVEGKKHMNFQYGYLEMRARIPFGGGAWPSLWLSGACRQDAVVSDLFERGDIIPANFSAEFDIVEYTTLAPNLHKWFYDDAQNIEGVKGIVNKHSSLGAVEKPIKSDLGMDPNQSYVYQTIGFDWTPEDMTIYINGEKYYSYNWKNSVQLDGLNDMSDFLNPVFIRLNNHLLPKNIPSDYSSLPCEFFVDYVRLYQKPNTGGLWLAE